MIKVKILEESARNYCNCEIWLELPDDTPESEVLDKVISYQKGYRTRLDDLFVPEKATDKQLNAIRRFDGELQIKAMQKVGLKQLPEATKEQASDMIDYLQEFKKELEDVN